MKISKYSLALLVGLTTLASCNMDLDNPNQQTTSTFGETDSELEEAVIAAYHHTRFEGTYARVGYTIDVTRGDEVWNSSQVWYLEFDDFNVNEYNEISSWPWRDWYMTVSACNYLTMKCGNYNSQLEGYETAEQRKAAINELGLSEQRKRILGQALFLRGMSYYNLAGLYQNPFVLTDYNGYDFLKSGYAANGSADDPNAQYDLALTQAEKDLSDAMYLLPSKAEGGEWAKGRANSGAAAGYYARVLMQRHKYSEALAVLKDIINGVYGTYRLMDNYGDNFREGTAYENNDESLYEVQFLDYGTQGNTDEWTPVNINSDPTQGHAVESNFAPGTCGGWADLSASYWLYELFKSETTTAGKLDPRLYWTIGTYEDDWNGFEYGNVAYGSDMKSGDILETNSTNGGLPVAKNTNLRTGLYSTVVTGLHCGINLRLMRYSDVLLRAAECENEVNGPTAQAISWINQVRSRAKLANLSTDGWTKDKLFEQIANVERPKEFGCEFGRGFDLIRWGFYYSADRLQQLKEHSAIRIGIGQGSNTPGNPKDAIHYGDNYDVNPVRATFEGYTDGEEFLPIYNTDLNADANLVRNNCNLGKSNASYFSGNGWTVHPVVDLSK